ncbi:8602_t:CDS:1 [Cetraspora pellucida]|uniref:8602_t:CDS:1 n=1 Tax=Cetraspora pellucida TaxID=1433469 RepID=A0ACA9JWU9_9GLOM|nr:8602_t:CDS:1 [Cetraspora pellucida]
MYTIRSTITPTLYWTEKDNTIALQARDETDKSQLWKIVENGDEKLILNVKSAHAVTYDASNPLLRLEPNEESIKQKFKLAVPGVTSIEYFLDDSQYAIPDKSFVGSGTDNKKQWNISAMK